MKKAIGCIGQGFVGGSLTTVFAEHGLTVYVHDKTGKVATGGIDPKFREREPNDNTLVHIIQNPCKTISEFVQACEAKKEFSNIYFVCVPTPMSSDGSADLSIVESVLNELANIHGTRIAVVKSTVPPGTTETWNAQFEANGLHVIFCPEFLREATALDDMRNQDRIILGGPRPWINTVKHVLESTFPNVPIIKTSSTTAEMVKYVSNVHLAVKVSLANEFYQICEALDKKGANIDYDKVVEYATLDKRLGLSHWKVPGPMPADDTNEPAFGFAGSCFIKDINALMHLARSLGVTPTVMQGAWTKNLEVRPQRDWEKLVGRAVSATSEKDKTQVLYWSKIIGHFVDKFTGKRTFEETSCTSDREWCETLIEVCIDAGNFNAKKRIKNGIDTTKEKLFNYPVRLLMNRKNSEYFKSSVLFTTKPKPDFPTQVTETIGTIGSIFTIVLDDCIADDVIYVGDYAEIYICDTSGQVKP